MQQRTADTTIASNNGRRAIAGQFRLGRVDYSEGEGRPVVVIDGKEIDWDHFGRMLRTYEGWQFKMEIYDKSEERYGTGVPATMASSACALR